MPGPNKDSYAGMRKICENLFGFLLIKIQIRPYNFDSFVWSI